MFTDHDQAMARALREVMPETYHGLCTWHLRQNDIRHLGNLMKDGSCFLRDFSACLYNYKEESDFEVAWSARNGVVFNSKGKEVVEDPRVDGVCNL